MSQSRADADVEFVAKVAVVVWVACVGIVAGVLGVGLLAWWQSPLVFGVLGLVAGLVVIVVMAILTLKRRAVVVANLIVSANEAIVLMEKQKELYKKTGVGEEDEQKEQDCRQHKIDELFGDFKRKYLGGK